MAGPMTYLTDHRAELRQSARRLLPSARSVLCLGKLYFTPGASPHGISRYAWGTADYHDVLKRDLKILTKLLHQEWGEFEAKICVDTAPLLERAHATLAGLGWIGKNTCLINQPLGSWFFLGEILVSLEVAPDAPPPDRCGSCRRCIDACPTSALVPTAGGRGWQLDARLCISTWTIEQRGALPPEARAATGSLMFGCDICQEVCPWNRRAPQSTEAGFQRNETIPPLEELALFSPEQFRDWFRSTPLWRIKYQGLLRNICTVMGNSGQAKYIPVLEELARHPDPAVSEHARWALGRIDDSQPK